MTNARMEPWCAHCCEFLDPAPFLWLQLKVRGSAGGSRGGDWAVRVSVSPAPGAKLRRGRRISLVLYVGDEGKPPRGWSVMPDWGMVDTEEVPVTLATGEHKGEARRRRGHTWGSEV